MQDLQAALAGLCILSPIFIVTLGLWLFTGYVGGNLYQKKGHDRSVGFIAGLLLGPVGLILAAVSPKNEAGSDAKQCNQVDTVNVRTARNWCELMHQFARIASVI